MGKEEKWIEREKRKCKTIKAVTKQRISKRYNQQAKLIVLFMFSSSFSLPNRMIARMPVYKKTIKKPVSVIVNSPY